MPLAETSFNAMSREEQDRVGRDLYGTETPIEESPELIERKLAELEKELDLLGDDVRKAYDRAIRNEKLEPSKDEYNITGQKFRVMFLRSERFDARRAAMRLVGYFTDKLELFGEETLSRRITQDDFVAHDDKKALISGGISFTGSTDLAGRSIIMVRREQAFRENLVSLRRVCFFSIMNAVEDNEISQRKGIVVIADHMGAQPFVRPSDFRVMFPIPRMVLHALPVRMVATHIFYDDVKEHCILNFLLVLYPKDLRARFHAHYQKTYLACLLSLLSFGMDPDILPITADGSFRHEMLWNYLQLRRRVAELQKVSWDQ